MCQCKPALFIHETVVTAIANSLKRDIASTYKTATKGNVYNQILYVNLLMYAFADELQWPELFVKASVYLKVASLWFMFALCTL